MKEKNNDPNKIIVEQHIPCPSCPSSDAYCIYEDGHGYCFSCGHTEFPNKLDDSEFTYEYVPLRGLQPYALKHYGAITRVDKNGKPHSIAFPYANGASKIRLLDKKEFYSKGDIAKAGLFGRNRFSAGSHKTVTITEGELDAISLYQVLSSPVVSVQSSGTAARDCRVDRAWLNSFEKIYLAFDGDEPGRSAVEEVARLFDYNKVFHVKFTKRKDANEYLQAGEEGELKNVWWNSKKFLPDTVISSLSEFKDILETPPKWGQAYPFNTLNNMTYGIRTGETVLITAQEGVGKTEVMHAIEHKILKETSDAVAAIFLEEPKRRHLQALAGIELSQPVHLPDCTATQAEVFAAVSSLVGADDRLHVYSHFGSDDPESLLDTIRFLVSARGCRYVFLDHITMAVSGLRGEEDERRALDYLSTRLEMMVKELDFALILVSHVNDKGYTRGSRNISKVADIRIDLHRDVVSPDPIERETLVMTVSKSRDIGQTGPAGKYRFDQFTRTYTEIEDGEAGTNSSGPEGLGF